VEFGEVKAEVLAVPAWCGGKQGGVQGGLVGVGYERDLILALVRGEVGERGGFGAEVAGELLAFGVGVGIADVSGAARAGDVAGE
jgi:hypothetical protein